MQITKLEAARRQLKVAIRLMFNDDDPVAVHTLVGAASAIISDLVEHYHPDQSWDNLVQEDNSLSQAEYFRIKAQRAEFP